MKIEYVGKDYNVSDQLKKITDKKCRKLKKYVDEDAVAKFIISLENNSYKTELVVSFGANQLRAETESENPYKNLDVVIPKIQNQMSKNKSVWEHKKKGRKNETPSAAVTAKKGVLDEEPPKPEF